MKNTIPQTRKEIETSVLDAANFYHKELNLNGAKVKIGFKEMRPFLNGFMNQMNNHDGSIYYSIYINNNNSFHQSVATMAHEMVHVKQFYIKDFIRKDNNLDLWKGYDINWIPYIFKPWEIQAFHDEIGLFNKYIAYKKYPAPSTMFKMDLYFNACLPYIAIAIAIMYLWILKTAILKLVVFFGK